MHNQGFGDAKLSALGTQLTAYRDIPMHDVVAQAEFLAPCGESLEQMQSWWKDRMAAYPELSALALLMSSWHVTSADVERAFSCMNWVKNPRRNRLTTANAGAIVAIKMADADDQRHGYAVGQQQGSAGSSSASTVKPPLLVARRAGPIAPSRSIADIFKAMPSSSNAGPAAISMEGASSGGAYGHAGPAANGMEGTSGGPGGSGNLGAPIRCDLSGSDSEGEANDAGNGESDGSEDEFEEEELNAALQHVAETLQADEGAGPLFAPDRLMSNYTWLDHTKDPMQFAPARASASTHRRVPVQDEDCGTYNRAALLARFAA